MKFKNDIEAQAGFKDAGGDLGVAGQLLSSTGTETNWIDQSTIASGSAEVLEVPVKNLQGSALTKGDPVYISGSVGASGRLEVQLADAGNSAKMPAVGLLKQDLAINEEGFVVVTGKLRNLITSPIDGVTPVPNTVIYVKANGSTGAALTTVKPGGSTNLIQNMGKVGRVSASADGTLIVSSILRSNDVPNLPLGRLFVGTSANTSLTSDVVYIDDANDRVGIGTTNPGTKLEVDGVITATGGTSTEWNTAYTDRNKWDGGATGLVAATGRTSLELGTLATLNSVNAATITDNSVGAAELNVSGNGTTAQYLRSDGDGTFTWATPTDTTYGVATDTVLGLIELFSNTDQTVAANAVTTTAGRTYGLQLNSANQGVINVPWTDTNTTYTAGGGLVLNTTEFSHADTSAQASVDNANGIVIQDVTLDTYGHVTGLASVDLDGRYYTESEADSRFFNVAGDTVTGDATFNGVTFWRVSAGDAASQRADSRDDATNFSRLHWYGLSDTGATSNFRHAWYDGANYINVTANASGRIDFSGSAATMYIGSDRVFDDGYHPNADTLTTARTINGTSFNGSANITTANWGTARTINGTSINGSTNYTTANWGTTRTITIGNTGKSVNGSANVSWTLAEIGAQAALTNPVTGTGTTNYIPKFTGSTTLGNSLVYDNGTNVGIGTDSPDYPLHVVRDIASFDVGLFVGNQRAYGLGDFSGGALYLGKEEAGGNQVMGAVIGRPESQNNSTTGTLIFQTRTSGAPTEKMRITSSGNVGIGTTAPNYKLEVNNTSAGNLTTALTLNNGSDTANTAVALRLQTDPTSTVNSYSEIRSTRTNSPTGGGVTMRFLHTNSTSGAASEMMRLDYLGVGVGTAGTTTITESRLGRFADGTAATPAYSFSNDINNGMYRITTDTLGFSTAGTEKLRISSAGNVSIGNTNNTFKLDVSGTGRFTDNVSITTESRYFQTAGAYAWGNSTTLGVRMGTDNVAGLIDFRRWLGGGTLHQVAAVRQVLGGSSRYGLGFLANDISTNSLATTVRMYIDPNNGNVGIGTTSPVYQLQLSTNSAAKPTSNVWTVVSDSRVKENIRPYTSGLNKILQIEPKLFDYNGKAGFEKTKDNVGIIAQEIKKILPETVNTYKAKLNESDEEETELYSYDGHALTFALVNSIKELNKKIEQLETRIQTLENK